MRAEMHPLASLSIAGATFAAAMLAAGVKRGRR